ncbi:MAG: LPXTG cell wall anchor domain-containing protein [Cyclobacteriaceae bacterium]
MKIQNSNFGLSGLPDQEEDDFIGKKARRRRRKRRKRRREGRRKKRRMKNEKKQLSNDHNRADLESKKAQTEIMKSMMGGDSGVPQNAQLNAQRPNTQQAGMGGNVLYIVLGVLLVGGYFISSKKKKKVVDIPVK